MGVVIQSAKELNSLAALPMDAVTTKVILPRDLSITETHTRNFFLCLTLKSLPGSWDKLTVLSKLFIWVSLILKSVAKLTLVATT